MESNALQSQLVTLMRSGDVSNFDAVLQLLLKEPHYKNSSHERALLLDSLATKAVDEGSVAALALLLDSGADVNGITNRAERWTLLHLAALGRHHELTALLIARGANIEACDVYMKTPLWSAAVCGHEEACRALLMARANPKAPDHSGRTPLHAAASTRRPEAGAVCKLLIEAGADVNATDSRGLRPLDWALSARLFNTADVLIASGTDLNLNVGGERPTALFRAIYMTSALSAAERAHVCLWLLERGANPDIKNEFGRTPVQYAMSIELPLSAAAILSFDADPAYPLRWPVDDLIAARLTVDESLYPLDCLVRFGASDDLITKTAQRSPAHVVERNL